MPKSEENSGVRWCDGKHWSWMAEPEGWPLRLCVIPEKRKWFAITGKQVRAKSRNLEGAKQEAVELLKAKLKEILKGLEE